MEHDVTRDRIEVAALGLFLKQDVKRTNLGEVAFAAGVARITVYRYFGDKRGLVRAVCTRIAGMFQRAADERSADSVQDLDARLKRLGRELSGLPKGNLLARLEEISRLYPDVYREFREVRQSAVEGILRHALAAATQDGVLRKELNSEVLKAIFWAAVVGLIEDPTLISSNVPLTEIVTTVSKVFRHGIFKNAAGGESHEAF
jgi:AcrR family transcriptional regulator